MLKLTHVLIAGMTLVSPGLARAQEKTETKPKRTGPPIKVQFLVSHSKGDKKVASLPYTLWVNADDKPTHLRQGVRIPVPSKEGQGFQYLNVGMNIDCSAEVLDEGRYKLDATVEQSSLFPTDGGAPAQPGPTGFVDKSGAPLLGSFYSSGPVVLRDGQSAPYATVTDPVTGDVLRVEVTLNLVK
jgi:hypothetical protein